jgi:hypothetical protein
MRADFDNADEFQALVRFFVQARENMAVSMDV